MVFISNLKQKIGQDLPYVQGKISELNNSLNKLLLDPVKNAKEITYTRGKLLKYMSQEIDLIQDSTLKQQKKSLFSFEINRHKQQLSTRIYSNKKSENNRISTELGLKIEKTINSYKQISLSSNKQELTNNILNSVGNTISTAGSALKVPAIGVTKVLKSGAKLTSKILTAPLHIQAYLLSKLINPNAPYKGMVVGSMSNELEKLIRATMEKQEEIIRRI